MKANRIATTGVWKSMRMHMLLVLSPTVKTRYGNANPVTGARILQRVVNLSPHAQQMLIASTTGSIHTHAKMEPAFRNWWIARNQTPAMKVVWMPSSRLIRPLLNSVTAKIMRGAASSTALTHYRMRRRIRSTSARSSVVGSPCSR